DGTVFFHLLGKVNLQGLDADQVRDVLAEKYSRYLVNPSILVTLQASGDRKVVMLGEVNRRGTYQLDNPRTTILDMIAQAGGVSGNGDRTGILVARRVEGRIQVRPYDMDLLFDPTDPRIRTEIPYVHPGDVVFVIRDAGQEFLEKMNLVSRALRTVQQGERLISTTRQVGRVITGQARGR
ncbi:MAG: polysaccharide biosynthesis/export family protein, partial [Planctomycetota bacterium]